MANDLIDKEVNSLFTKKELDTIAKYYELEAKVKFMKESKKDELIKIFKKFGIKSFKNENISITYVPPIVKNVLDVESLKQEGLYDSHLKILETKESIRITVNYED